MIELVDPSVSSSFLEVFHVLVAFFFDDGRVVLRGEFPDLEVGLEENYGVGVKCVAVGEHVDEGGGLEEDVEEGVDREED